MSDQGSQHLALVQRMGARKWEGFNPIAPRSHRWMMDFTRPPQIRAFGWGLWRTIDRDPEGRTGPAKKTRTHFAHDTRVGRSRGFLKVEVHMAKDLDMTEREAEKAFSVAVEQGLMRTDEIGRIIPCGDAPEPRRTKHEEDTDDLELYKTKLNSLCPYFQQLNENRQGEFVQRYLRAPEPFRQHLDRLEPEQSAKYTWNFLVAAEYDEQLEADAIAAARAQGAKSGVMAESGYEIQNSRGGRPRVDRELIIEFKARIAPAEFFTGKSEGRFVQKPKTDPYKNQNGSVQKLQPYSSSTGPTGSQSEVNHPQPETSASEEKKVAATPQLSSPAPPTTPPETLPKKENADALSDPNPVIDKLQHFFRRKLGKNDPLHTKFPELASELGIPQLSLARWMDEKLESKQSARYKVFTPGAMYEFAVKDLPEWIPQRSREIENDRVRERAQTWNRERGAPEPFDTETFNAELRSLVAKKGL